MPIKLDIPFNEKDDAKRQGAWWMASERTWAIPDNIKDLRPFGQWLPLDEGYIVKHPYVIARTNKTCWKCYEETSLIALGARNFYSLRYQSETEPVWTKLDYPVLFSDIDFLEKAAVEALKVNYPFFKLVYSNTVKKKYWGNTCVHCNALQGDNFNFSGFNAPFAPATKTDARKIKIEHLPIKFDYYICAESVQDVMYDLIF